MIKKILVNTFRMFWEETTIRISDREVLELGGFLISFAIFLGILYLLNLLGVIH